jgi:hypothetical protein
MKKLTMHAMRPLAIALAAVLISISTTTAADMDDCRSMEDAAARLACYDSLNAPAAAEVSVPAPTRASSPTPTPTLAPASSPAPASVPVAIEAVPDAAPDVMDDSVGKESVTTSAEKNQLSVTGHVSSCREDNGGQHRFYFDNGQIWKQKDNKRIPWRECDFDVTISKDFFGYKMTPATGDRTIRISRIQ